MTPVDELFAESGEPADDWGVIDRAHVIWRWLGSRSDGEAAFIDARQVQKGWLEASPGLSPLAREE